MLACNQVKITRILNQTSIDLGEYVINPYMGCEFGCLYCYVRSNRVVARKNKPWGEYVDVRINAPELLEKEIKLRKPKSVFLGSTTECFQPVEKQYQVTKKILEILNKHKIYYVILTRSPYIVAYMDLLKSSFCKKIYFTVNKFSFELKQKLEAKSPDFQRRDEAVKTLLDENIPVVPYVSPVLPWISDLKNIFERYKLAEEIEFECLNFRLNNINDIKRAIAAQESPLKEKYESLLSNKNFYTEIWDGIKQDIEAQAKIAKKRYNIYIHHFGDYFKNTYEKI